MKAFRGMVWLGLALGVAWPLPAHPAAGEVPETKTRGAMARQETETGEAKPETGHHRGRKGHGHSSEPGGATAAQGRERGHHRRREAHGHSSEPGEATVAHAPIRVRRILYKAQRQMKLEEYEEASRTVRDFLAKYPNQDHCLLQFSLGNAEYSLEKPEEALEHFQAAVELDPTYGPAWLNLGQVALEQKRYGLAAEALTKGYEMSGERNSTYLYYAAVARILNGEADTAVAILEPLVNREDHAVDKEWLHTLLHAYLELGRETQAERLLNRMLRLFGTEPETWKLWYRFEANRENYTGAAVAMTIYSYLTPLSREEEVLLGDLYMAVDVPLVACRYYEDALETGASPSEFERLASACIAAHRPADARQVLERALGAEPTAKLWTLLGDLLYTEDDYQGAWEAFRQSTKLDGRNGRSHLMMGYCALQLGKKKQAASALRKAADDPRQRRLANRLLEQAALP